MTRWLGESCSSFINHPPFHGMLSSSSASRLSLTLADHHQLHSNNCSSCLGVDPVWWREGGLAGSPCPLALSPFTSTPMHVPMHALWTLSAPPALPGCHGVAPPRLTSWELGIREPTVNVSVPNRFLDFVLGPSLSSRFEMVLVSSQVSVGPSPSSAQHYAEQQEIAWLD